MRGLAKRFALPLVRVLRGGFIHRLRTPDGGVHVSRSGPWDALNDLLAPLIRRYKAARGDDAADPVREMATWSLREWLRRQNAGSDVHAMADSTRGFFLADPEELSVLPVVAQLADGGAPAQTPIYRIAGGNSRLLDALVAQTPARLLLGHEIRAVAQAADRVIVRATDARGLLQEIEGDALVLALPASTLRDLVITPPLPEEQRHAIERVQYGRATKVAIQCASEGLSRRRAQAFATGDALGAFWDATDGQPASPKRQGREGGPSSSKSVINFLGGGSASAKLRARACEDPARLLSELCWLGLAGAPVVISDVVTWEKDPFARGGYAFADPAFDPAWKPLLSRRAGRIVFAGEHTSENFQGYMEGAVESGMRAMSEITNAAR